MASRLVMVLPLFSTIVVFAGRIGPGKFAGMCALYGLVILGLWIFLALAVLPKFKLIIGVYGGDVLRHGLPDPVSSHVKPLGIAVLGMSAVISVVRQSWHWAPIIWALGILLALGLLMRWLIFDRWLERVVASMPGLDRFKSQPFETPQSPDV